MKRLSPEITPEMRRLFKSPVDAPRRKTVELVRLDGKRLASKAADHLTMSREYRARATFAKTMAAPPSCVYPSWCKPTVQRVYPPRIPAATDDITKYVADFENLNNLRRIG